MVRHVIASATFLLSIVVGTALKMPPHVTEEVLCEGGACGEVEMPYERRSASQPGYQWNDAGKQDYRSNVEAPS